MTTITVNSAAALTTALKAAHAGDTVQLQAGTYSGVSLSNLSFATNVTVTSVDPAHQAVLTDLTLTNVNGLSFTHLEFSEAGNAIQINKSQHLSFDHDYVHGSLDGNAANDGSGLNFLDTSSVSVTNSEFTQLRVAISAGANTQASISNITVSGNNIHGLEKAGVIMAGASNVSVTGNFISDIRVVNGDHPDAIQFFTTGTKVAAHDIVISDNVIMRGDGDATQGIFLRDQVGTLPFHNLTIQNNLVVGTGYGGIYVMGVDGAQISGNELVSDPGKTNNTWMLVQGGTNVTSTNNTAQNISFDGVTNVKETGDVLIAPVSDGGAAAINAWAAAHGVAAATKALALASAAADVAGNGVAAVPVVVTPIVAPVVPVAPVIKVVAPVVVPVVQAAAIPAAPVVAAAIDSTTVKMAAADHNVTLVEVNHTALNVTGNALDNVITGNQWANNLQGGAGNDTLIGNAGDDGLSGGTGNDTYLDPSATAKIVENSGEGTDTVIVAHSYTLTANVENLVLETTNAKDWNGTGNELNNVITGNSGVNILSGMGGDDTMDGGGGNDDITGGVGNDRLTGGVGNDVFRFTPGSGHDVITDFGARGEHDMLDLSAFTKAGITSTMHDVGHDVVISFSNGDSITLLNDNVAMLKPWFAGWIT